MDRTTFFALSIIFWIHCGSNTWAAVNIYNDENFTRLGAPYIDVVEDEITLELGETRTIVCESHLEVTWVVSSDLLEDPNRNIAIVPDINIDVNSTRPFRSTLTLANVTVSFVGEYYCVHSAMASSVNDRGIHDLKNSFQANSIYVFVKDEANLLVPVHTYIYVMQYSEFVIPCKPTHREVQVSLKQGNGNNESKFYHRYDPRYGFYVYATDVEESGDFECTNTINNEMNTFYTTIHSPEFLNKPSINASNNGHATEGETITLKCIVQVPQNVHLVAYWTTPNNNRSKEQGRTRESDGIELLTASDNGAVHEGVSTLTVLNAKKEDDEGTYVCQIQDANNMKEEVRQAVLVLPKLESYIKLWEPNAKYEIETKENRARAQWILNYQGHPEPQFFLSHKNKTALFPTEHGSNKYEVKVKQKNQVQIAILNVKLEDQGTYMLLADNGIVSREVALTLKIKAAPKVSIKNVQIMAGEEAHLVCKCRSGPASQLKWAFFSCPLLRDCMKPTFAPASQNALTSNMSDIFQYADINFTPSESGMVVCYASNAEGKDEHLAEVRVRDTRSDLLFLDRAPSTAGERDVNLTCAASIYNYTDSIVLKFNGEEIKNTDRITVINTSTKFSWRKTIAWKEIIGEDSGDYNCWAQNIVSGEMENVEIINFDVIPPVMPKLRGDSKMVDAEVSISEPFRHDCQFEGEPIPTVVWYKDDVELINQSRITLLDDNTVLQIEHIAPGDEGEYKCVGNNRVGSDSGVLSLKIKNLPMTGKYWFFGSLLVIIILTILSVVLWIRIRKARKRLFELKAAGLANFENGCIESINPALSLDEQADLLPYDKKYEFPREKLKLGKQLGAGAFGVVVKADATGILPHEEETIVAVKTVKPNADNEVMRALISELKIMIHMGQHLNVVNLLGAVTSNIAKREVLVIVEYCRFGNVQNFLQKHRDYFVDQINPETDEIDPTVLTREQREQRWSNDSGYEYNSTLGGNHVNSKGYMRHSGLDYFPGGMDSCNTEKALISTNSGREADSVILSNNSVQPAWRSNYRMDYKGPIDTITTSDVISWGFQVSRGMDYLSSRKVLHGDLAARNILLCDNNVVKICDFGLARSMYKCDNYKKKGESPLPFKWLAIESISDQVFSTYSDVWAFGIVLWELFSLAKVPYPGMNADQTLYLKLRDGYRMEKPKHANQDLYEMMLNCWNAKPESRPLFHEIEERLGKMMQDTVKEHYVDLNEPYLQINADLFSDTQKDYIAALGPPDQIAPPVPLPHHYVNNLPSLINTDTSLPQTPDYLHMSPVSGNVQYTPHAVGDSNGKHFEYPPPPSSPTISNNLDSLSPVKSLRKKAPGIPEEMPMLKGLGGSGVHSDSESETNPPSPKPAPRTFGNVIEENLKASNNYVNVPKVKTAVASKPDSPKKALNTKDAVSNPGYVTISMGNDGKTKT